MFATNNRSREEVSLVDRKSGIIAFDLGGMIIPDERDMYGHKLCVHMQRHYPVIGKKGEKPQIQFDRVSPCDGSCKKGCGGMNTNIRDPYILFRIGVYMRVPENEVLVLPYGCAYEVYAAGSYVAPHSRQTLKNGESIKVTRDLPLSERIHLRPKMASGKRESVLVTYVEDTITNENGTAVISKEQENTLRARAAEFDREIAEEGRRAQEKYEKAQQAHREASKVRNMTIDRDLQGPQYGFTSKQVDDLRKKLEGRMSWAYDAVERARVMIKVAEKPPVDDLLERMDYDDISMMGSLAWYSERKDWRLISAGAEYIVSIGGVPADKNKK